MTESEQRAFLTEGGTIAMATHGPGGTIQLVAMFYGFLEGSVGFLTKSKSQKTRNLRRDPTVTCMLERGSRYEELRGLVLVGEMEVIEDPPRIRDLARDMLTRRLGTFDDDDLERAMFNRVALKLNVHRVVSWDHRKIVA